MKVLIKFTDGESEERDYKGIDGDRRFDCVDKLLEGGIVVERCYGTLGGTAKTFYPYRSIQSFTEIPKHKQGRDNENYHRRN